MLRQKRRNPPDLRQLANVLAVKQTMLKHDGNGRRRWF